MIKTYQFKLYNSDKNDNLHHILNIAGQIRNHCIALHRRYYRLTGKYVHQAKLKHHVVKLKKKEEYQHWNLVGSQAIQNIIERLDLSYKEFFKWVKKKPGRKISPPKFKKIKNNKSITLKQSCYEFLDNPTSPRPRRTGKIKIHKKTYKYFKSREIEGNIKTLTIKRGTLGDIYLYAVCELPDVSPNRVMSGKSAGFDFGLHTFITSSDGMTIESPLFYQQSLTSLRKTSKNLATKQKESNNRIKAKLNLARIYKKVCNQRRDFLFKTALQVTQKYDYIFLENLSLQGMIKLWGRKINDLAWAEFVSILEHVSKNNGCKIVKIDRFFPSSKTCHICNYVKDDLTLNDGMWQCTNCNSTHDRDVNAAKNIHIVGTSTIGLGDVRP